MQRNRLDSLEGAYQKLNKQISELLKKGSRVEAITGGSTGFDGAIISELEDELAKLKSELEGFKNETSKHFNELDQGFNDKANRSELDLLE